METEDKEDSRIWRHLIFMCKMQKIRSLGDTEHYVLYVLILNVLFFSETMHKVRFLLAPLLEALSIKWSHFDGKCFDFWLKLPIERF